MAESNYHLFSVFHTTAILHASHITNKTNWLAMVHMARATYDACGFDIIYQAISKCNVATCTLTCWIIDPLFCVPRHKNSIAIQDNLITNKDQQTSIFFQ